MKKVILAVLITACRISLTGCTTKQPENQDRPDLSDYEDKINELRIELTCQREAENIIGVSIGGNGTAHVLRGYPSLSGSIAAQSEAFGEICEQVADKVEEVAARCGEEIDADLEKKIRECSEKELLHIVRPELVCVKYGDDHVPDKNGYVTDDIRFYCSVAMQQSIAPISNWMVSLGNAQQRSHIQKIVNEFFEINLIKEKAEKP